MVARSRGGVRSAEGARGAALSLRTGDRRRDAAVRLRNRRRSIPAPQPRRPATGWRRCCRSPRPARRRSCAGRSIGSTPSLVAAVDAAGETIDLTLALAGDLRRRHRLQHRAAARRSLRADASRSSFATAARSRATARCSPPSSTTRDGGSARCDSPAPTARPAYYDERGVSMRRFFLASPLKFQPVVTSGFSRSRFHPILREYRAHLGVDYRAPAGAPVVAVSDGVVVSAGIERRVRADGASAPRERLRVGVSAPLVDRRARRCARPPGRAHRARRLDRPRDGSPPRLSTEEKRRLHQPARPRIARCRRADPVPAARMAEFNDVRDRAFAAFSVPAVTRASKSRSAPRPASRSASAQSPTASRRDIL